MLRANQLSIEQITETGSNCEEEVAEVAPAGLHVSNDRPTPTISVHPGMLPHLSKVTLETTHHVRTSNRANHPGQPVLDITYNEDDDDSDDSCYSALDPLYAEAPITHNTVLPIHQN